MENANQGLKGKFFSFEGRLNRKPYFCRSLVLAIVYGLLGFLTMNTMDSTTEDGLLTMLILFGVLYVFMIVSSLSLNARRLHDLNKSGWMLVLLLVPFVDIVFLLYIVFARGTRGRNMYGDDPLESRQ